MGRIVRTLLEQSAQSNQGTRRARVAFAAAYFRGGNMIAIDPAIENLTLSINQEIRVRASLEKTFAALLEQMGPLNTGPDGTSMKMTLEAWPGGRWFRDLGDDHGPYWG